MEWTIGVYPTETANGIKQYVSCLTPERVLAHGLPPEAIVGSLLRPLKPREAITPALFIRNKVFVDFMHEVIARRGPRLPGLIAQAETQASGFIYLIDERTRTPAGTVPPGDIIGAFEVRGGQFTSDSYKPNPQHAILSTDGFFQLNRELKKVLLEELEARRP